MQSTSATKPAKAVTGAGALLTGAVETVAGVFGGKRTAAQWREDVKRLSAKLNGMNGQLIDIEARRRQAALDVELDGNADAASDLAKYDDDLAKLQRQIERTQQALAGARGHLAEAEPREAENAHRRVLDEHAATAAELKKLLAECDQIGRDLAARAVPLMAVLEEFRRQHLALRPKAGPNGEMIPWPQLDMITLSSRWAWFLKHLGLSNALFGATAESPGTQLVGVDFAGELGAIIDRLTIRE